MSKESDHSKYAKWIDPNQVIPYERNAKQHTDKQVANIVNSIRRFGWQQDTVLTTDNVLVIGHGRRLAALKLGCEMPYHVVDKTAGELTDDDIRELRIADNATNAETGLDMDMLTEEIDGLSFDGFNFDFVLSGIEETPDITEDEPPEPQEDTKTKQGQIFQLGRHRLMCGDSTNKSDIEKLMDGARAQLLLTDPPYNVDLGSNDKPHSNYNQSILNDNMEDAEFIDFMKNALSCADVAMDPGAAFYIFYAGLQHTLFDLALKSIENFKLHEQLIWVKGNHVLGRHSDYQWKHEPCLYGWKTGKEHYFTDSRAETTVLEDTQTKLINLKKSELIQLCERLLGERQATTVLFAEKQNCAEMHPSIKPQGLLAPLILNSSKPGWNVLDIFGGSGSTLIACEQLGRTCYTMELDPHFVDVILQRYESFTGDKAILI